MSFLESAVVFFFYLVIACVVFGVMFALNAYAARKFPEWAPFARFVDLALAIMAAFVAIAMLLAMAGHPIIRL